jgi:ATP-dependent Clp protease ATP-binding subunit ClpB
MATTRVYGATAAPAVQSAIGDQLAKALLGGQVRDGDTVLIDRAGDGLSVVPRR